MSMKAARRDKLANPAPRFKASRSRRFIRDMGDRMGGRGSGHYERVRPQPPGKMATAAPTMATPTACFVMGGNVKGGRVYWQNGPVSTTTN